MKYSSSNGIKLLIKAVIFVFTNLSALIFYWQIYPYALRAHCGNYYKVAKYKQRSLKIGTVLPFCKF